MERKIMNGLTRRQNRRSQNQGSSTELGFWSPFQELSRVRSQLGALVSPLEDFLAPPTSFFEGWTPNVELYEDKDKFTIRAEIPGMKKEDIDVSMSGNTVTVSGEKKQEEEHKEGDTYRSERFFGRFQRSFTLGQPVNADKIEASYKDGVLTLIVPKAEEAKRKQIEVKSS